VRAAHQHPPSHQNQTLHTYLHTAINQVIHISPN
jgi:rRNA pseudouridine-1189 N-methylase Emg1 (Nep1/Mra1 family)